MVVSDSVAAPRSVVWAMVVSAATCGGIDAGGDPSGATSLQGVRPYSLRAIYFRRDQFRSTADCLTAAYTQRLPLEVCQ